MAVVTRAVRGRGGDAEKRGVRGWEVARVAAWRVGGGDRTGGGECPRCLAESKPTETRDQRMSQQTIKQQARHAAKGMAERRRREQLEREGRLVDLAVQVMTAIGERDAAVADAERRAAHALREMTDTEGLPLSEAVEWCDEQISVREATRLRRLLDGANGRPHGTQAGTEDASASAATG